MVGRAFLFSVDRSPCFLLSAFMSQLLSPRYRLEICRRQDFASALETAVNRCYTKSRDTVTVIVGSLDAKLCTV
jgi:hypothetical protein